MPAALGFATIAVLLLLTMVKRASVLVALSLLPVLAALDSDGASTFLSPSPHCCRSTGSSA
jgi:Mg2+/citrate symporter